MTSFIRKLRWLTRRRSREAELREELQFHLEARRQDNLRAGMPSDAARQDAVRRFGSRTLSIKPNLTGRRWVRLEIWDVAANGAFTQPVWIE